MKNFMLLTPLLLAGCLSTEPLTDDATLRAEQATHLPRDYRKIIVQEIRTSSEYQSVHIRDAAISNSVMQSGAVLQGGRVATVCIRYKADSIWSSEGLTMYAKFMFLSGTIIHSGMKEQLSTAQLGCFPDHAYTPRTYTPIPEINHDRRT
jgi:hypothetical protein